MAAETDLHEFTRGDLVKMVEPKWIRRVVVGITAAIETSFREDLVLRPVTTRDEVKRRFRFCVEGFVTMRREFRWAVPRILDEIPAYLRHRLDGTEWSFVEGPGRWVGSDPSDGELAIDESAAELG
jgi:hypothetical protein